MAGRTRSGLWILLALCAGLAALGVWLVRGASDAPVGIAGRESQAPIDAGDTGAPRAEHDLDAPRLVTGSGTETEQRTSIGPAADDDVALALELELHGPDGEPLADARVRAFDDTTVLGHAKTDAQGLARVRAGFGPGRVLVTGLGAAPWLADVDLTPGRRRLDEPERPTMFGRAFVDRAEPGVELEFELVSDRALFDAAEIPPAVRTALEFDASDATRLSARCDVHGAFAFRGLVEPFTGRIDAPERFAITRVDALGATLERRTVHLAAFVPSLALELVALPALVGRVVESGGTPVARAEVGGWIAFASPNSDTGRGRGGRTATSALEPTTCDAEGRFAIPIGLPRGFDAADLASAAALPATERVSIDVRRDEHSTWTGFVLQGAALPGRWDVGDLVLPPAKQLELIVRSADQKPIEGAVVLAEEAKVTSDANGSAKLVHVEEVESAAVGKVGFHPEDVALAGPGPIEVVLRPTNRWTVSFVDAAGAPIAQRRFVLTATHALFLGDDPTRPARTHVASGATDAERAFKLRDGGGFVAHFRCDEKGRAVLSDLASPFTLRVTDGLGATLEERVITLGAEESREELVKIETRGGAFAGRVVDNFGASLAGASVRLNARALRASEAQRTDAAGEFRFDDLQGGRVRLEIEREGFSPLAIDDYELVLDAEPVEFRLHQAGTLSVDVVDELGNAVPTADLRVRAPQHPNLPVRRRGINRFELRELPGDPVTAVLDIGGRTYEREVDTRGGDTRVVVPRHGRAQVVFVPAGALLTGGEYRARVRSSDPNERVALTEPVRTQRSPFAASFDALLPGRYEVQVEWRQAGDRDGRSVLRLGATTSFTVTPGALARVEVRE